MHLSMHSVIRLFPLWWIALLPLYGVPVACGGRTEFDGGETAQRPCASSPKAPTSLGSVGGYPAVSALVSLVPHLFVGLERDDAEDPVNGRIVGVSLAGQDTAAVVASNYISGQIFTSGEALVYVEGTRAWIGSAWQDRHPNIAILDTKTGLLTRIENPPGLAPDSIGRLAVNANGELFWFGYADAPGARSLIARWDPSTRATTAIEEVDTVADLLADESAVYVVSVDETRHLRIWTMPTRGGPHSILLESPNAFDHEPRLQGLDENNIYYTIHDDIASGILTMPKSGGEGKTVVPDVSPQVLDHVVIDGTHVYWVDSAMNALRRAPKNGGEVETIVNTPGARIRGVAVDACNVYWVSFLGIQSEAYMRAR